MVEFVFDRTLMHGRVRELEQENKRLIDIDVNKLTNELVAARMEIEALKQELRKLRGDTMNQSVVDVALHLQPISRFCIDCVTTAHRSVGRNDDSEIVCR